MQENGEVGTAGRRQLPDFLATEPYPDQDRAEAPAPMRNAPMDESVPYRDPQPTAPYELGESDAPFYIDPVTGEQIRVRNWIPDNQPDQRPDYTQPERYDLPPG